VHCAEIVPCAPPRRSAPNQTIRIGRAVGWLMRGAYRAALPARNWHYFLLRAHARARYSTRGKDENRDLG
jgi:hypothetical protein